MHAPEHRARRALKRLAAVTVAAALGTGAFASPAAAQVPTPIESFLLFDGPHHAEGDPSLKGFEAYFGDDFTPGAHTVGFTLAVDAPDGVFTFSAGDIGDRCEVNADRSEVVCTQPAAERAVRFEFEVYITEVGLYPYTSDLTVNGESVSHHEGEAEVLPEGGAEARNPYMHFETEYTGVEPGSGVDVRPSFLQEDALPADTAAIILTFDHSTRGDVAEAVADYDNCISDSYDVTCAVTDFPDEVGTYFEPTGPIVYEVGANAPGPADVCGCTYRGYAVDAETLGNIMGDHTWDPDSDDLLGLREGADPGTDEVGEHWGRIAIETTENPVDLSVDDVNVKGAKGTEATVDVKVANDGPANALWYFDEPPGTYAVLGSLPTGLTLDSIGIADPDEPETTQDWYCPDRSWWGQYLPEHTPDQLEALDFACFFHSLDAGEETTLPLNVKITESGAASDGTLEVVTLGHHGIPDSIADTDPRNNTAEFSVNATGTAQLPKTGTSLTMVLVIAGVVLIAGALLLILSSRRRKTAADDSADESSTVE
jgi:LPXTG-motif cell wall-anchored protein